MGGPFLFPHPPPPLFPRGRWQNKAGFPPSPREMMFYRDVLCSSDDENKGGDADGSKAVIMAKKISEEYKDRRSRKEAFELIRRRERKGKGRKDIFYKGANFSRKDVQDAVRKSFRSSQHPLPTYNLKNQRTS